jgi:DnaK suppressor protein
MCLMELDLQKRKSQLLKKKAELEQSMVDLTEAHPTPVDSMEATGGQHDIGDVATDALEMEDEKMIFMNGQSLLMHVNKALQRLEDGTYRLCQECGQPIAPKRLEALPWAERCVRCEARLEQPLSEP